MPHPRPPSPTPEDRKAIDRAVAEANRAEAAAQKGNPVTTLMAAVLVAALVAAGAYFGLQALGKDDDVERILPPPSATPIDQPEATPSKTITAKEPPKAAPDPIAAGRQAEAEGKPTGYLDLDCKPECEIEIDGRPTGKRSPEKGLKLAAGKHQLRLVNRPTALWVKDTVEIRPDETTRKYYNLVMSARR